MHFGKVEHIETIDFSFPEDHPLTEKTLSELPKKQPAIYIGCPVWGDKSYVGTIYPQHTRPADFLHAYTRQFNSIEVNATRYKIPSLSQIEKWKAAATPGFKFCLKFPQIISHRGDLNDSISLRLTDEFLESCYALDEHLGVSFLQLPPHFKPEKLAQLDHYLSCLPKDYALAVEVRHANWFSDEKMLLALYECLHKHQTSLVITDVPGRRDVLHQMLTNDTVFVRFGGHVLHPSDYRRIDDWCMRLTHWIHNGLQNIYFFMHQPAPYKFKSANLAAYMINKLSKTISVSLKKPVFYNNELAF